jgi:hypothetical protein
MDEYGIATKTYTHGNREAAFQFYNVNDKTYITYLANGDPIAHWLQFQTGNYQIPNAEFY